MVCFFKLSHFSLAYVVWGKKRGNFKTNRFFEYIESLVLDQYVNFSKFWYQCLITKVTYSWHFSFSGGQMLVYMVAIRMIFMTGLEGMLIKERNQVIITLISSKEIHRGLRKVGCKWPYILVLHFLYSPKYVLTFDSHSW